MVAKIVAGSMLGLAIVAVGSLLWMWRRAHKRVAIGRTKSAMLRSLYPFVLGLGGWCLGALVVMTTMPTVALDNELLAVICTGVPAGLGIYWVWVRRDMSAAGRTAGWVLASAAALVGAWLGFHVSDAFGAGLVYAVTGATIAANAGLIVYDVVRERSQRRHLAAVGRSFPRPLRAGCPHLRRHRPPPTNHADTSGRRR